MVRSDRRAKYLSIFRDEAQEHVSSMTEALLELEQGFSVAAYHDLLRRLHTIKGSAFMIELNSVGEMAHALEDLFKPLEESGSPPTSAQTDMAFRGFDLILAQSAMEYLGQPASDSVREYIRQLRDPASYDDKQDAAAVPTPAEGAAGGSSAGDEKGAGDTAGRKPADRRRTPRPPPMVEGTVRVNIEKLDRLLDLVGELLIHRSRLYEHERAVSRLAHELGSSRVPVGLTERALEISGVFTEELTELGYLFDDIRYQTMEVRMLPVASILDDFYRTVRSLSRELKKQVRLEIRGRDTEVDKRLLEMVRPILVHIIRNCIDHGIESPQERQARGKPEEGLITVEIASDGRIVTFTITDDGAGLDPEKIRERAIERGLVTKENASRLGNEELFNFIFCAGFSTANQITEISGRGVGMDVVRRNVEELKGTFSIESEPGSYTKMVFSLPMTLSVITALMVEAGGQNFAIPLPSVVETVNYRRDEIVMRGEHEALVIRDIVIPLVYLPHILGFVDRLPSMKSKRHRAVIVKRGVERLALAVDAVTGDQEVVVKSLGNHLKRVRFVLGATFISSGIPVLILNVIELFDALDAGRVGKVPTVSGLGVESFGDVRILVVDDSFTTRTMEQNILESVGFKVETAVSGEDALDVIARSDGFDLCIFDIDMPGINGIELTRRVRRLEQYRDVPIVVISSFDDSDRIEQCRRAGARETMIKKEFDQKTLIETIRRLVKKP